LALLHTANRVETTSQKRREVCHGVFFRGGHETRDFIQIKTRKMADLFSRILNRHPTPSVESYV
jgi:hypothetical protein